MIVGVDIESISNFEYLNFLEKPHDFLFLSSFFSKNEVLYCLQFDKAKSFAILFSIKESIIKILKNSFVSINFLDIEILNFYDRLKIMLKGELYQFCSRLRISFSYDKSNVLTCAILEE